MVVGGAGADSFRTSRFTIREAGDSAEADVPTDFFRTGVAGGGGDGDGDRPPEESILRALYSWEGSGGVSKRQ